MKRLSATFAVLVPLVLSIIPGWGHIWLRRYNRGLAIFLLFFAIVNLELMVFLRGEEADFEATFKYASAAAVGLFVFTIVDVFRITVWLRSNKVLEKRRTSYRRALTHYLRSEYGQARELALRMTRSDPLDVAALFVLGMIQREAGEKKKAIRTFRRALRSPTSEYWNADVQRELKNTKAR